MLGSKRYAGASYKCDPAGNNKIVATSHEIDHPDIRPALRHRLAQRAAHSARLEAPTRGATTPGVCL